MVKVNINGHELEFEKELIELFEYNVCSSFVKTAKLYLIANFPETSVDEIFAKHSEQEIKNTISKSAKLEIALFKGEL